MRWIALSVCVFVFVLLLLRFVYSEVIFQFRRALVGMQLNRLFLAASVDGSSTDIAEEFSRLLGRKFRTEVGDVSEDSYVESRLLRIRQMNALRETSSVTVQNSLERYPEDGIRELGRLVADLAPAVQSTDGGPTRARVSAMSVLKFLMGASAKEGIGEAEVRQHFLGHPLTGEELSELLMAAIYGILYRRAYERDVRDRGRHGLAAAPRK